jgi:hypothetical protein
MVTAVDLRALIWGLSGILLGCGPRIPHGSEAADSDEAGDTETTDTIGASGHDTSSATSDAATTAPSTSSTITIATSDGSTSHGPGSGGTDELDFDALCAVVLPEGCLGPDAPFGSCQDECVRVLTDQPSIAQDAFAECVATDPLCFLRTEDCVWGKLYPDPFAQTIELTGTEFEAFEGLSVRGGLSEGDGVIAVTQTTIVAGTFLFSFDVILPMFASRLVLAYVDVDGDGNCTPGVDFGISEHVPISGSFDDPTFVASIPANPTSSDFVCSYLN